MQSGSRTDIWNSTGACYGKDTNSFQTQVFSTDNFSQLAEKVLSRAGYGSVAVC